MGFSVGAGKDRFNEGFIHCGTIIDCKVSGKDTGGSQFFFTTAAQPHLEGRYTAFGEIVEGADVVDRLLEGEVIQKATASKK